MATGNINLALQQTKGEDKSALVPACIALQRNPRSFNFLQAMRICINGEQAHQSYETAKLIGKKVRLRANPSFGFPSADIDSATLLSDGRFEFVVNFMGLYGPSSPLPDFYTQNVIDEIQQIEAQDTHTFYLQSYSEMVAYQEQRLDIAKLLKKSSEIRTEIRNTGIKKVILSFQQLERLRTQESIEEVLGNDVAYELQNKRLVIEINHEPKSNQREFLDIFNHRFITHYLTVCNKYKPYQNIIGDKDYIPGFIAKFIGIQNLFSEQLDGLDQNKLLAISGILSLQNGSAEVIKKVVAHYFNLQFSNVYVEENIVTRCKIEKDQQNRMGLQNISLGYDFVSGASIRECTRVFRLHILNLTVSAFKSFLPSNDQNSLHAQLNKLLDFVKMPEKAAELCLHLAQDEIINTALNSAAPNQLGYTSWLSAGKEQDKNIII